MKKTVEKSDEKSREYDSRKAEFQTIWGKRKVTRLNKVIDPEYCGAYTIREIAAVALADAKNFPRGLDTPVCIGDFEGNFCTDVLSISLGGPCSDHMCLMGDPHGSM